MIDTERILISGDWHGSWPQADTVLRNAREQSITTIVQVGDFGISVHDKPFLHRLQSALRKNGMNLYFVDGNHEDFKRLNAYPVLEDGTRQVRENIYHLPRAFRWTWNGVSFMALGGAASVERTTLVQERTWWAEELITEDDVVRSSKGHVDVMICHDSPASAPNDIAENTDIQEILVRKFGLASIEVARLNRERLRQVTDSVTPRYLFHGHYHKYMHVPYVHADGSLGESIGLDQGGTKMQEHVFILDLEEMKQLSL